MCAHAGRAERSTRRSMETFYAVSIYMPLYVWGVRGGGLAHGSHFSEWAGVCLSCSRSCAGG